MGVREDSIYGMGRQVLGIKLFFLRLHTALWKSGNISSTSMIGACRVGEEALSQVGTVDLPASLLHLSFKFPVLDLKSNLIG